MYCIKQTRVDNTQARPLHTSYADKEICRTIARVLSKLNPFCTYTVLEEQQPLSIFWNGEEKELGQENPATTEAVQSVGAD